MSNKLSDYYTFEQFEFPNKEKWQFGDTVNMTINGSDVRVFFSKDNLDINGGCYELVTEGEYHYYEFFKNGEEIMSTIKEYGIDFLPNIVFLFLKGLELEYSNITISEKYIAYGVKTL